MERSPVMPSPGLQGEAAQAGSPRKKLRVSFASKYTIKKFATEKGAEDPYSPGESSEEQDLSPTTASPATEPQNNDGDGHSQEFPSLHQMLRKSQDQGKDRDSLASNTSETQMQRDITNSFQPGGSSSTSGIATEQGTEQVGPGFDTLVAHSNLPQGSRLAVAKSGTPPRLASQSLKELRGMQHGQVEAILEDDAEGAYAGDADFPVQRNGNTNTAAADVPHQHGELHRRLFEDSPGGISLGRPSAQFTGDLTAQIPPTDALVEDDVVEGLPQPSTPPPGRRGASNNARPRSAGTQKSGGSTGDIFQNFKKKKMGMTQAERKAALMEDSEPEFEDSDMDARSASVTPARSAASPTVDLSALGDALQAQGSVLHNMVEASEEEEELPHARRHPESRQSFGRKIDAHKERSSTGSQATSEHELVGWGTSQEGSSAVLTFGPAPSDPKKSIAKEELASPPGSPLAGPMDVSPSPKMSMNLTTMSMDFEQMNRNFDEQVASPGSPPCKVDDVTDDSAAEQVFHGYGGQDKAVPGKIAALASHDAARKNLAAVLQGGLKNAAPKAKASATHSGTNKAQHNLDDSEAAMDTSPAKLDGTSEAGCLPNQSSFEPLPNDSSFSPPRNGRGGPENSHRQSAQISSVHVGAPRCLMQSSPGAAGRMGMSWQEFLTHSQIEFGRSTMQAQRRSEMPREQDSALADLITSDGPGNEYLKRAVESNKARLNQCFEQSQSEVNKMIESMHKQAEAIIHRWERSPTSYALMNALLQAMGSHEAMASFRHRMAEFHKQCKAEASAEWAEIKHQLYQRRLTAMQEHTQKLRKELETVQEGISRANTASQTLSVIRDSANEQADMCVSQIRLHDQRKKFRVVEEKGQQWQSACQEQMRVESERAIRLDEGIRNARAERDELHAQLARLTREREASQLSMSEMKLSLGYRTCKPVLARQDLVVLRFRRGHHLHVSRDEEPARLQLKPAEEGFGSTFRAPRDLLIDILHRAWAQAITDATGSHPGAQWVAAVPRRALPMVLVRLDVATVRLAKLLRELEQLKQHCAEILEFNGQRSSDGASLGLSATLLYCSTHTVEGGYIRRKRPAAEIGEGIQAERYEVVFGADLLRYPDVDWSNATVKRFLGRVNSEVVKQALCGDVQGSQRAPGTQSLTSALTCAARSLRMASAGGA